MLKSSQWVLNTLKSKVCPKVCKPLLPAPCFLQAHTTCNSPPQFLHVAFCAVFLSRTSVCPTQRLGLSLPGTLGPDICKLFSSLSWISAQMHFLSIKLSQSASPFPPTPTLLRSLAVFIPLITAYPCITGCAFICLSICLFAILPHKPQVDRVLCLWSLVFTDVQ